MRPLISLAVSFFLCVGGVGSASGQDNYRFVRVTHNDTIFGFDGISADLNDLNQVVFRAAWFPEPMGDSFPTVVWTDGALSLLEHPAGAAGGGVYRVTSINNSGLTAGNYFLPNNSEHVHAYAASVSSFSELGLLPKTHPPDTTWGPCVWAWGHDVNNLGQVAGIAQEGDNFFLNKQPYVTVWTNGQAAKIPNPDGLPDAEVDFRFPIFINDAGQLAGTITTDPSHGFFGIAAGLSTIPVGVVGVQFTEVRGLSETGTVVGTFKGNLIDPDNGVTYLQEHAWVSDNGGPVEDLNLSTNATWRQWTYAYGVNSKGDIVGANTGAAVLWRKVGNDREYHLLRGLVTEGDNIPNGILSALDINENGVILATYGSLAGTAPCLLVPIRNDICVNTASDLPDINPGDGVCDIGEVDQFGRSLCSMRAAIQESNALPGYDTICFDITNDSTIETEAQLPAVTDPALIDGLTQPPRARVHISGQHQETGHGLVVTGGGSTIRGLMLNRFPGVGLTLMDADSNVVENCYIGTDETGSSDLSNDAHGVLIDNSSHNDIGRAGALDRMNVIAWNGLAGVYVQAGDQNNIVTNSFFLNDGLAIDLAPEGINLNDSLDADSGPNSMVNYPIIDSIIDDHLYGSLWGTPNDTYILEVYRSESCDPSGAGEGAEPLFTHLINTDADGLGPFDFGVDANLITGGQVLTCLAVDGDNTSEFSPCFPQTTDIVFADPSGSTVGRRIKVQVFDPTDVNDPVRHETELEPDSSGRVPIQDFLDSLPTVDTTLRVRFSYNALDSTTKVDDLTLTEVDYDNGDVDYETGEIHWPRVDEVGGGTLVLERVQIGLKVKISLGFQAGVNYGQYFQDIFNTVDRGLSEATNGLYYLDSVTIRDNLGDHDSADFCIPASNFGARAIFSPNDVLTLPPVDYYNEMTGTADELAEEFERVRNLSADPMWNDHNAVSKLFANFVKKIARDGVSETLAPNEVDFDVACDDDIPWNLHLNVDYGLLQFPFQYTGRADNEMAGELSADPQYADPDSRHSQYWAAYCGNAWNRLAIRTKGLLSTLDLPPGRALNPNFFQAGVDYSSSQSGLLPSLNGAVEIDSDPFSHDGIYEWAATDESFGVIPDADVYQQRLGGELIYQGRTSKQGRMGVRGAGEGDILHFLRMNPGGVFLYEADTVSADEMQTDSANSTILKEVNDHAVVWPSISLTSGGGLEFEARTEATIDAAVLYRHNQPPLDLVGTYDFGLWHAVLPDDATASEARIGLYLASMGNPAWMFFQAAKNPNSVIPAPEYLESISPNGELSHYSYNFGQPTPEQLAAENTGGVFITSSSMPISREGLAEDAVQLTSVHFISSRSGGVETGVVTMSYAQTALDPLDDGSTELDKIRIFGRGWDHSTWTQLGGTVDTLANTVAVITESEQHLAVFAINPATDVDDDYPAASLPDSFELGQNYPNPFNPSTTIVFDLPRRAAVRIDIFNVLGQRVRTLINGPMTAGRHVIEWDGSADSNRKLATGVYLYRLTAGEFVETRKMVLLK